MAGYKCVDLEQLMRGVRGVPRGAGVYSIHWFRNGGYVSVHRILRLDAKSVLYIGSASSLRKRLRTLVNALSDLYYGQPKRGKHTFATSMAYTGIFKNIGLSEPRVCFKAFGSGEGAQYYESLALFEYSRRHGEPPPLTQLLAGEKSATTAYRSAVKHASTAG